MPSGSDVATDAADDEPEGSAEPLGVDALVARARRLGTLTHPIVRDGLVRLWIDEQVARLSDQRRIHDSAAGPERGPRASVAALAHSRRVRHALDVAGQVAANDLLGRDDDDLAATELSAALLGAAYGSATAPDSDHRAAIASWLARANAAADVTSIDLAAASTPADARATWRHAARAANLSGRTLPLRAGGTHHERAVVAEGFGRVLARVPWLSSAVLAVDLLLALDDDAAAEELVPRLTRGELTAAVATSEDAGGVLDPGTATLATRHRDGSWVLDGTKTPVVDGDDANVVVVYAGTTSGAAFFLVDGNADGVVRTPLQTLDGTRGMARIDFAGVAARPLAGDAEPAMRSVRTTAAVALGAEQVGGLRRLLELALAGRARSADPTGLPDPDQSRVCVDAYCAVELAAAVLGNACVVLDGNGDVAQAQRAAALLSAYAGPAYVGVATALARSADGVLGEEARRHVRRAISDELLLGGPVRTRTELAGLLGL